ncbi:putative non-specific serine/threonine protein kinase [Helianthus annuus]|nr:putative non-specific serine/threonine protein kinase [Helianthus annuus]
MGNTCWGLGMIQFLFICIFSVTITHKCVGGGNLTTPACSEQERLALLRFKQSIKDEQGMLSSWGVGNDCCRWERVGCDDATGRVVSLHLRASASDDYFISGDNDWPTNDITIFGVFDRYYLASDGVNSCLAELVHLRHLDLSGNDFQGSQIPEFVGSLKQLRYLNLSNAGFFAWISSLSKLEHLDLSGMHLRRTQNLNNLLYIIPSLLKLGLSRCGLSITHLVSHHPNSSKELAGITHLDLSENDFNGQLPGLFLNMTSLAFLDLSKNHFSMRWSFKNFINMMPSLLELRLSGCELQQINLSPSNHNYSTHSNIERLDLSFNQIEGRFPYVLTNMSSLLSLDLSVNMLNSSIPVMPNLIRLDISRNKLSQIKDVGIWRQCHLKELMVSNNDLEGEMISPSTNVSKCSKSALELLRLDGNKLSCLVPEALGRFTNLRVMDLSDNKLIGPIPESLGKLRSLQVLSLSSNNLIGHVPKFHGQLTILQLDYNQLNGSVPESFGRLTTLTHLSLESNRFTGPIPISLGRLTSLRTLSLSSNLFNGTIPNSFGQLTKLYFLDVSHNRLQGVVSEDHFANLSMLKYLNANSNNELFFNISREWMPPFQLKVVQLHSCKIKGEFPQWVRTQKKLDELVLSNASIHGPLPTWLRLMPIIRLLDLSYNKLTGPLTNLPSVYEVRFESVGILLLQNNLFRGLIPRWLCTRTDLHVLDLSRNNLTGEIPKCLFKLPLSALLLGSNRLSGVVPSVLGYPSLQWLQLNDNNLTGELPQDFGYFYKFDSLGFG